MDDMYVSCDAFSLETRVSVRDPPQADHSHPKFTTKFLSNPDEDVVEIFPHQGLPVPPTEHLPRDQLWNRRGNNRGGDDDPLRPRQPFRERRYFEGPRPTPTRYCCQCMFQVPETHLCGYAGMWSVRRNHRTAWRMGQVGRHLNYCSPGGNHYVCNYCGFFDPTYPYKPFTSVCPCCVLKMRQEAHGGGWNGVQGYESQHYCCTCGIICYSRQKCGMDGAQEEMWSDPDAPLGPWDDDSYAETITVTHTCPLNGPHYTCVECSYSDQRFRIAPVCGCCVNLALFFFDGRWNGRRPMGPH